MRLTRATFAVMLKMSGLVEKFEELLDDFSMDVEEVQEVEGEEKYKLLTKALLLLPDIQESGLLQEWTNATRMRKWFSDKKLEIAEEVKARVMEQ